MIPNQDPMYIVIFGLDKLARNYQQIEMYGVRPSFPLPLGVPTGFPDDYQTRCRELVGQFELHPERDEIAQLLELNIEGVRRGLELISTNKVLITVREPLGDLTAKRE